VWKMDTVKIFFNSKHIIVPRIINSSDIAILFCVKDEGLHVRCKSRMEWVTVWPSSGTLVFSDEISEGYLIAVCEDNQSQPIASQRLTGNEQSAMTPKSSEFFFGRRGDLGTRPVPSMKLPAPLKRRRFEQKQSQQPVYKTIVLTDIIDDEISNIYDVPVDLNKLEKKSKNFTIDDIQRELAYQVGYQGTFILTNKKGLPIRDMPNTRGKSLNILKLHTPSVFVTHKHAFFL